MYGIPDSCLFILYVTNGYVYRYHAVYTRALYAGVLVNLYYIYLCNTLFRILCRSDRILYCARTVKNRHRRPDTCPAIITSGRFPRIEARARIRVSCFGRVYTFADPAQWTLVISDVPLWLCILLVHHVPPVSFNPFYDFFHAPSPIFVFYIHTNDRRRGVYCGSQ